MYSELFLFVCFLAILQNSNSQNHLTDSKILNNQLEALTESLKNMKVFQFQQLFDQKQVNMDIIFQPDFLFSNNVFASMGDNEFKRSLRMFTLFEPTITSDHRIQALVTIKYRMDGKEHKMEKEVEIAKNSQSPTGYVFTGFKSV